MKNIEVKSSEEKFLVNFINRDSFLIPPIKVGLARYLKQYYILLFYVII